MDIKPAEHQILPDLDLTLSTGVLKTVQDYCRRIEPGEDPREQSRIEVYSDFARSVGRELAQLLAQSADALDWFKLQEFVREAIETSLARKNEMQLLSRACEDQEFLELATDCLADILPDVGTPVRKPQWGTGERNSVFAAIRTTNTAELRQMADDIVSGSVLDDGELSEALLLNKDLPFDDAARLARWWKRREELGQLLLSRSDSTAEVLDEWSHSEDMEIAGIIATHRNTSIRTLERIASNAQESSIITVVLSNERLNAQFIERFIVSPVAEIRAIVARRIEKPMLLKKLAVDKSDIVRLEVVRNRHTPPEVIDSIAETDGNSSLVAAAVARVTDSKLLDRVAERWIPDFVENLKIAILQNPHSSDFARTLAVMACLSQPA